VSFSPDGRSLVYAVEVNNSWDIYTVSIARKEEPYFYASTLLKTEPLVSTRPRNTSPNFHPTGRKWLPRE